MVCGGLRLFGVVTQVCGDSMVPLSRLNLVCFRTNEYLCKPQCYFIKVGFKGVLIICETETTGHRLLRLAKFCDNLSMILYNLIINATKTQTLPHLNHEFSFKHAIFPDYRMHF